MSLDNPATPRYNTLMSNEPYNGWANKATWSVTLWANNEESCYRAMMRHFDDRHDEIEVDDVEDWFRDRWGDATPDGWPLDEVDWAQVANMVQEAVA